MVNTPIVLFLTFTKKLTPTFTWQSMVLGHRNWNLSRREEMKIGKVIDLTRKIVRLVTKYMTHWVGQHHFESLCVNIFIVKEGQLHGIFLEVELWFRNRVWKEKSCVMHLSQTHDCTGKWKHDIVVNGYKYYCITEQVVKNDNFNANKIKIWNFLE